MPELTALTAQVERTKGIHASAVTLLHSLGEKVRAVAGDKARTLALADELGASADTVATAIEANSPAPTPTPEPTPEV